MWNTKQTGRVGLGGKLAVIATIGLTPLSCADDSGKPEATEERMSEATEQRMPEKTTMEDVKRDSQELAHTIGEYSEDQRDEAIQEVQAAMSEINGRLDALEQQVENNWDQLSSDARKEAEETLNTLRDQRDQVAESYEELQSDSGAAWDNVKSGFSDAYTDISQAFDKAEEEFDDSQSQ